jgi:hypothetical protein
MRPDRRRMHSAIPRLAERGESRLGQDGLPSGAALWSVRAVITRRRRAVSADVYRSHKYRLRWEDRDVAAFHRLTAPSRTAEVVKMRSGGDPGVAPKSAPSRQRRVRKCKTVRRS